LQTLLLGLDFIAAEQHRFGAAKYCRDRILLRELILLAHSKRMLLH
jgi:hypothetical protein